MNFSLFRNCYWYLILGLLGLFLFKVNHSFAYVPVDRIIAIVNEDVIMLSELELQLQRIRGQMERKGESLPPAPILQRQILDTLIQNRIQLQLADSLGIKVDDEILNRTIANITTENQLTLTQFKEILEQDGFSYEQFREDIRDQITLTQLRKRQVENRIIITDREIDNFLANQELQEELQLEIRLSHILFSVPENAEEVEIKQISEMASKVREDLLAGADFAEIAKAISDGQNADNGGDLGWRKTDQIPTLFINSVPEMAKSDISELIRSPSGFHLIKVTDIKSQKQSIVEQTHARHILIKPNALVSNKQAQKKLEQLLLRIKNGDDFAILAKGNSDDSVSAINGGDLGWRTPGELVPKFQRVMDALQPGEISDPFQTDFGWHIVQVLERRQHDNTELIKRSRAREIIYKRKLDEATQNWMQKLHDESYVEYRMDVTD